MSLFLDRIAAPLLKCAGGGVHKMDGLETLSCHGIIESYTRHRPFGQNRSW